MKTLMTLGLLLTVILLFPGCYTILLVEPDDEDVSFSPNQITIYVPEPYPTPNPLPGPWPIPPPAPSPFLPPAGHVSDNPPSTPPSTDDRREIRTGRGPIDSNPAPARNDNNNTGTRDSGAQRGRR